MCRYLTEKVDVAGSGKGSAGWFTLSEARCISITRCTRPPSTR